VPGSCEKSAAPPTFIEPENFYRGQSLYGSEFRGKLLPSFQNENRALAMIKRTEQELSGFRPVRINGCSTPASTAADIGFIGTKDAQHDRTVRRYLGWQGRWAMLILARGDEKIPVKTLESGSGIS